MERESKDNHSRESSKFMESFLILEHSEDDEKAAKIIMNKNTRHFVSAFLSRIKLKCATKRDEFFLFPSFPPSTFS
jgi:hypothetical protein